MLSLLATQSQRIGCSGAVWPDTASPDTSTIALCPVHPAPRQISTAIEPVGPGPLRTVAFILANPRYTGRPRLIAGTFGEGGTDRGELTYPPTTVTIDDSRPRRVLGWASPLGPRHALPTPRRPQHLARVQVILEPDSADGGEVALLLKTAVGAEPCWTMKASTTNTTPSLAGLATPAAKNGQQLLHRSARQRRRRSRDRGEQPAVRMRA